VVAGDNGDRRGAVFVEGAQPTKKPEPVDQRHPQVENDCVRAALLSFHKSLLGAAPRAHLIPREAQHARKCLGHGLIVVDDENLRRRSVSYDCRHCYILTYGGSTASIGWRTVEQNGTCYTSGFDPVLIQPFGGAC